MQTKNTRDGGYNSDLRAEVEALSRRFNELEMFLRNYLEEANDEKIKSNRRLQDTLYNLDEENIPSLPGIIKISKEGYEMAGLIAEVNENGEVVAKASVIVEAINNQSSVKIKADVLDIDSQYVKVGDNINLDASGNISIGITDEAGKRLTQMTSTGINIEYWGNSANYGAGSIILTGSMGTTTIDTESVSSGFGFFTYLNGYKISFDENGYLKGVIE